MLGSFRPPESRPGVTITPRPPSATGSRPIFVLDDPDYVRDTWYLAGKRAFDLIGAFVLALVLVPVIVIAALAVKLTSRGPAFYTQTRLGRLGQPFVIWKLRTMCDKAEEKSGVRWSVPGDKRITPVGYVLRRLHIDEFPQLLNVVKGEMSLVGPRPERPEFFPILEQSVHNYAKRLLVKPGVTGMAQVYLPPDEDIGSVRLKQIFDVYYIRHLNLWLDVRLTIATACQAVGVPHGLLRPLLLLPRRQAVEQAGRLQNMAEQHQVLGQ